MTPARALADFVRIQIGLAGCCRAMEPLIELAQAGDGEAAKLAAELLQWMIGGRK